MTSLTTPFPILSQLKTPLLLVEVTPFDVLIGVLNPVEPILSYDSISPLPFHSLEDLMQNFFDLHNLLTIPGAVLIAFPLNFLEHRKSSSLPSPPFSWAFDQEEVQKRFGFSEIFVCDRGSAIAKAIPFLSPSDIQLFSNELPGYFSEPQSTCFLVNIDCGFEEVSLIPVKEGSLRIWKPFKNQGGALRLETDISYVQHLIDVMRHEYMSPYPTVSDFFENLGIERLYQTLYIDKGMEAYLRRKVFEAPRVIDPGAATDIDPVEINNPPRMSLEGMDISIASIEPRRIKREVFSCDRMGKGVVKEVTL